jgi:hypothetical protein
LNAAAIEIFRSQEIRRQACVEMVGWGSGRAVPAKRVAVVTAMIGEGNSRFMNKLIGLFLVLLMAVQLLYPLGLPGLKKRRDFWKLAVLAIALWSVVLLIRP